MNKMKQAYLLRFHYLGGFGDDFPCASSWYRDIKVLYRTTLEELNSIVLSVLGWEDHGHLFAFTVNGRVRAWLGSDCFVVDHRMFKGEFYSAAIPLSELQLQEGATFTYVYDFGDEHMLLFKVLRLEKLQDTEELPLLASQEGGSPPQYPLSTESQGLQRIWLSLNKSARGHQPPTATKSLQLRAYP